MDTVSYIKNIIHDEFNELVDKNIIREVVIEDDDKITVDQIEKLFKFFLVICLYLAFLKLISCLYESITNKKYLLGYRGIRFLFNQDLSAYREYFMKVSSCYLEAEFFIREEMNKSLLFNYNEFSLRMDTQLDSLK